MDGEGQVSKDAFDAGQPGFELVNLAFTTFVVDTVSSSVPPYRQQDVDMSLLTYGYCDAHYWVDIRTRCLGSFGFWPRPEELHALLDVVQLEQGDSLLQRI